MLNKENLVLDLDFTKGDLFDRSGNGNDGVLTNGEGFVRRSGNAGYKASAANSHVTVQDDTSLQLTQGTWAIYGTFEEEYSSTDALIDKRDAGGTNYTIYIASATTIGFIYNGGTAFFTIPSNSYVGVKSIIITKPSGSSAAKLYFDGVYIADSATSFTITTDNANLLLGGDYTGVAGTKQVLHSVLIYSDEKTASEVSDIHNQIIKRKTLNKPLKNTINASGVKKPSSGAAWEMILNNGKVSDLGDNNYDGEVTNALASITKTGLTQTKTIFGEPALKSKKGAEAYLNMGAAANIVYNSGETWGWAAWVKSSGNAEMLMSRSASYFAQLIGAGQVLFQYGTTSLNTGVNTYKVNAWHLIGWFTDGTDYYGMIDGDIYGPVTITGTPTSGTLRFGQYVVATFDINGGIGNIPIWREFEDLDEYTATVIAEYTRVANKVLYQQDFSKSPISSRTFNAGEQVLNTDIFVDTNGLKLQAGDKAGEKILRGTTFGSAGYIDHIGQPWGTYIIKFVAESGIRNIIRLYSTVNNLGAGNYLQIDFTGGANDRIEITTQSGNKLITAVSSVSAGEHEFKIQIAPIGTNNVTAYLDGVELTAASGSNPFSITSSVSDAQYMVLAPYGGGGGTSGIKSITHYFGIV